MSECQYLSDSMLSADAIRIFQVYSVWRICIWFWDPNQYAHQEAYWAVCLVTVHYRNLSPFFWYGDESWISLSFRFKRLKVNENCGFRTSDLQVPRSISTWRDHICTLISLDLEVPMLVKATWPTCILGTAGMSLQANILILAFMYVRGWMSGTHPAWCESCDHINIMHVHASVHAWEIVSI